MPEPDRKIHTSIEICGGTLFSWFLQGKPDATYYGGRPSKPRNRKIKAARRHGINVSFLIQGSEAKVSSLLALLSRFRRLRCDYLVEIEKNLDSFSVIVANLTDVDGRVMTKTHLLYDELENTYEDLDKLALIPQLERAHLRYTVPMYPEGEFTPLWDRLTLVDIDLSTGDIQQSSRGITPRPRPQAAVSDEEDIQLTIAHPVGDLKVSLATWILTGPGPRDRVRPIAARRKSTGEELPLTVIPLQYRNDDESRKLIASGELPDPWKKRE
jgi:hypothetical protein